MAAKRENPGEGGTSAPALLGRGAKILPALHPVPAVLPGDVAYTAILPLQRLQGVIFRAMVQVPPVLREEAGLRKIHLSHKIHRAVPPMEHGGEGEHPFAPQGKQVGAFPHAAKLSLASRQNAAVLPMCQVAGLIQQGAALTAVPGPSSQRGSHHHIPQALMKEHLGVSEIGRDAGGYFTDDRVAGVFGEVEAAIGAGGEALGLHKALPMVGGGGIENIQLFPRQNGGAGKDPALRVVIVGFAGGQGDGAVLPME